MNRTHQSLVVMLAAVLVLITGWVIAAGDAVPTEVVQTATLINTVRVRLDHCGEDGMLGDEFMAHASNVPRPAARPPLAYNATLAAIATRHAVAMAQQHFFDHVDLAGRTVGGRATAGGYRWQVIGENLAAGHHSIADAVRGWLLSTSHCRNLIDRRFTEFGVGMAHSTDPNDRYGVYWVLVLGKPMAPVLVGR